MIVLSCSNDLSKISQKEQDKIIGRFNKFYTKLGQLESKYNCNTPPSCCHQYSVMYMGKLYDISIFP